MARQLIRRTRLGVTVSAVAVLLAACGGDGGSGTSANEGCTVGADSGDQEWSTVLDEAVEQGSVTVYHVLSTDQLQRVADAFNEVCEDVEVIDNRGAADLIPRVDAQIASDSDGADVFIWGDAAWFRKNADHILEASGPAGEAYPADSYAVPGKAAVAAEIGYGMIVWNTTQHPDGFTDFEQLLDPSLRGRIGTREDMTTSYVGYLDWMEKNLGAEYLTRLGAQQPKFYSSVVPLAQAVASGEVGVANVSVVSAVKDLIKQGAPIDYTIPKPGYSTELIAGAIGASKRPAAARVFMEFLLSEPGQIALNGDGYGASPLQIEGDLDLEGFAVLDSSQYPPDVVAQWQQKFDTYFRR